MDELDRFVQKARAAQRAVDELLGHVVHPHKPGQQCDACEGFCLYPKPIPTRVTILPRCADSVLFLEQLRDEGAGAGELVLVSGAQTVAQAQQLISKDEADLAAARPELAELAETRRGRRLTLLRIGTRAECLEEMAREGKRGNYGTRFVPEARCSCEDWCGDCDLRTAPPGIGLS